jgi:hypothetical protein
MPYQVSLLVDHILLKVPGDFAVLQAIEAF